MNNGIRSPKSSRAGKIFSFVLVFMFLPVVASGLDISSPVIRDHADLDGLTTGDDHTQYQKESEKDQPNGYAGLDGSGDLPASALPNHAANHTDATDDIQDATAAQKGVATAAQITKLDAIESGATADQTAAEIKAAYESNANTNEFSDAEQTKLSGIESGSTGDQTAGEIKTAYESNANTNEFDDTEQSKLAGIEIAATADQTGAEIKIAYEAEANTNAFTDAEQTKLTGIETGATADQTNAEIKTAYEANANTNEFDDAEQTKLGTVESNAKDDQSAAEVSNTPAGDIAATDVQAAIDELDSEKSSAVNVILRDGSQAFTADQPMGGNNITGLPSVPSGADHATSKSYVDAKAEGLSTKKNVRARAQGNITISGPGATIDGLAAATGERFLLPLQTDPKENGIYVFNGAASAMTRSADLDNAPGGEIFNGVLIPRILEGTDALESHVIVSVGTGTDDVHTIGVDSITWDIYIATPDIHGLGDSAIHTSATFAELNGLVSDATLIDTTDARLSDARTPTVHAATHKGGGSDVIDSATVSLAGLMSSADKTKLDGVETAATADQTNGEIKTAYEANANTNEFDDTEQSKLLGIETAATADQTNAEIKTAYELNANTNEFDDTEQTKLGTVETAAKDDQSAAEVPFTPTGGIAATDTQAAVAEVDSEAEKTANKNAANGYPGLSAGSKIAGSQQTYGAISGTAAEGNDSRLSDARTPTVHAASHTDGSDDIQSATAAQKGVATAAQITKLDAIESGATADQTDGEIKTAYENNADTNEFDDAEQSKLAGLETATQEVWFLPQSSNVETNSAGIRSVNLNSNSEVFFNGIMPADFVTATAIEVFVLAADTTTYQWDSLISFAAPGEVSTVNDASALNETQAVTDTEIEALDVSAVWAGIAAGDFFSYNFQSDFSNIRVIGLRFKY